NVGGNPRQEAGVRIAVWIEGLSAPLRVAAKLAYGALAEDAGTLAGRVAELVGRGDGRRFDGHDADSVNVVVVVEAGVCPLQVPVGDSSRRGDDPRGVTRRGQP